MSTCVQDPAPQGGRHSVYPAHLGLERASVRAGGEESMLGLSFLWVCFLGLCLASEHMYN